ncbi:efflux RND transporter permease subunit [Gimesia aquarii]|uniref:Toluene efflux pump membrane transporter TtgH n=1 Tax=Gimesia aquarii TaxID=2527964 RepID=A0A517VZV0_9PLAN|nr:efflux RND transporter permease subunit [Gimesia aquarii]QDT98510.1 Toluene efflux pump membrane transporter TtgH [Gimesia aquarii]
MNLPALSMRYRTIVIVLVSLLTLWGVFQYFNMPRREDPEYTVRTCTVTTAWPGVPASKVEELITYPLEKELDSIDDIDVIYSTTTVGLSTIFIDAEETTSKSDIANVWDKVRAEVAKVKMPEAGIVPMVNDEYGDTYIMLHAIYQVPPPDADEIPTANEYSLRELDIFAQKLRDEIRFVDGVAKADLYGVRQEAIYIETDAGNWSQLKLTTDKLQKLVEARNIVASGGDIDTEVGRFSLKPTGELDSVEQLKSIVVGSTSGTSYVSGQNENTPTNQSPVYLTDLGLNVIRDYQEPPPEISRFTSPKISRPSVIVAITMKTGANVTELCDNVRQLITRMQKIDRTLPPDLAVTAVSDQSVNVENKINGVVVNVMQAIVIVIVVVYLIVGFRSAFVMAANIPIVVFAALALLPSLGVDLEQISLASIIVALGLLVDNAVQVCDQSRTNQMLGMPPQKATILGSNQVSMAMLGGTLTTVSAFLPMLIGLIGTKKEYVYSLPVTLSVILAMSWILAMSFCSILAASFIRPPKDPLKPTAPLSWLATKIFSRSSKKQDPKNPIEEESNPFLDGFGKLAMGAIRFKFLTIGISVLLLMWAIMLPVSSQFFPRDLRDQFAVEVWLPENAAIEQTNQAAKEVERILQKLSPTVDPEGNTQQRILGMRTMVGSGGARWYLGRNPEARKPNYAEILVRTTNAQYTHNLALQLQRIAQTGDSKLGISPVSNARVIPRELAMGPPVDAPIALRIFASGVARPGFGDLNVLRTWADRISDVLRNHPSTWDIHDTTGVPGFEMRVEIDNDQSNLAGVTNLDVAQTLNAYFSGQYLTTFNEDDHQIPVYLRLPPNQRGSLTELDSAFVEGRKGKVPLESIAKLEPRWEPARIDRRDLNRMIEIRARVKEGVLANDIISDVLASEEMQTLQSELPAGFWIEIAGEKGESIESEEQMGLCMIISFLLIVLCLVFQYNGIVKPIIILATLPLALIGALPGLYFTDNPLGFMPQLGILSLFGIVLNTAIIFFEFADSTIHEAIKNSDNSGPIAGLTRNEFRGCLITTVKKRLLPIFLTTATTIGGLIPLALSGGPLWEGMAWCMIYGLAVATMLTLLVIPALFAIFVEVFRIRPVSFVSDLAE